MRKKQVGIGWALLFCLILFGCGHNTVADNSEALAEWHGAYTYVAILDETNGEITPVIEYRLDVYAEDGGVFARFCTCGFQTYMDITAEVRGDANRIELIAVQDNIEDGSFPSVKNGSVLLTLSKEGDSIKTDWVGVLAPIECANGDYFRPIE